MDNIVMLVDPFHAAAFVPLGRCLLMLGYDLPATMRFRTYGLTQAAGKSSSSVWAIDSPCLLIAGAVAASIWRFMLPFAGMLAYAVPVAGIAALALTIFTVLRLRLAHRLHPYIAATALILALLSSGQQPLAAGVAGLLLLISPGYEQLIWGRLGIVAIWGRGSMGHAPAKEQEVLGWSLAIAGLCVWVSAIPPSVALPVFAIWAVWSFVISLAVTAELVFHTNDLPRVRLQMPLVRALQRHAVRLTIDGTSGLSGPM